MLQYFLSALDDELTNSEICSESEDCSVGDSDTDSGSAIFESEETGEESSSERETKRSSSHNNKRRSSSSRRRGKKHINPLMFTDNDPRYNIESHKDERMTRTDSMLFFTYLSGGATNHLKNSQSSSTTV